jgi:mono/diheme cytochrome c family protein
MTTKLIRTIAAAAAVFATGLLLAACASDNAKGPTDAQVQDAVGTTTEAAKTTTQATTTEATTTTEAETTETASADGKAIFTTSCAGCHTLAAADASGQVGPNLDQTKPSEALAVDRVKNGKAGMPAFEGQLSPEEITAVSGYVADNAGG